MSESRIFTDLADDADFAECLNRGFSDLADDADFGCKPARLGNLAYLF